LEFNNFPGSHPEEPFIQAIYQLPGLKKKKTDIPQTLITYSEVSDFPWLLDD
jgi:hypothetical protein